MLKIYFKIARRSLIKGKVHSSFINIAGLSIGMAVALVIALWIGDELSFDKYHQHYNRIAQVMQHQDFSGSIHTDKAIPYPLRAKLQNSYGNDFKYLVLSSWTNPHTLSYKSVKEMSYAQKGNSRAFQEPGYCDGQPFAQ